MTQRTFGFTQQRLASLPLPDTNKRNCYYDDKISGLGVMVYPTGKKTFFLYIRVNGQPSKIKLGVFPEISPDDARKRATDIKAEIYHGNDPRRNTSDISKYTFKMLFDRYINEYSKLHKKSWRQDVWGSY